MVKVSEELWEYARSRFRDLHRIPEVGFDLPKTCAYVEQELQALGISPRRGYGRCSVVGQIGNDPSRATIAFRADMDALPITETTGLPYASTHPGSMHACGHDSHTAILLAVAKYLKAHAQELECNVRLIFQPSEEGNESGAKMMVENGVMEDVECIVCTHCEPSISTGQLGICPGDYMAACIPLEIRFRGKNAHATMPQDGIHALDMAVEAYGRMKQMVAQEAKDRKYIWNAGCLTAGEVHNVIPELAVLRISFRFYDVPFSQRVMDRARHICREIADSYGGSVEFSWQMSTGPVYNAPEVTERLQAAMEGIPVVACPPRMSSEDFAWYLTKAPGALFRYGIRNEEKGIINVAHNSNFQIDEEGMRTAIQTFLNFALQYTSAKKEV